MFTAESRYWWSATPQRRDEQASEGGAGVQCGRAVFGMPPWTLRQSLDASVALKLSNTD